MQTPQKRQASPLSPTAPPKKGLINLGNTCFMNSALQCLFHTIPLTSYFLSREWEKDLNEHNPLGMGGKIPMVYAQLLYSVFNLDSGSSVAPRNFKALIGERNQTFEGYGQQDSHELLSTLLDGLHEDLNRVQSKVYAEDPELGSMTESEFARICWDLYLKRNNSVVVDLFQAQLKSKTECMVCHHKSLKFDPYMYLQLPIPEPMTISLTFHAVPKLNHSDLQKPKQMTLTIPRNCTIEKFKTLVAAKLGWKDQIVVAEIFNQKIHKLFEDDEYTNTIAQRDVIYAFEYGNFSDLFQSTAENVPLAVTMSFGEVSSYMAANFGIPIFIGFPKYFSLENRSQAEIQKRLGEICYLLVVEQLSRFAKVPLFRRKGSAVSVAAVVEARAKEDGADFAFDSNDLCTTLYSDEWEPIPDLFDLYLAERLRYSFQEKKTKIYPMEIAEANGMEVGNNVASPMSELSDLATRMNDPTFDENDQAENAESIYMEFTSETSLMANWNRDVAEFIFGKGCIPESKYSNLGTTVFDSVRELSKAPSQQNKPAISIEKCMAEFTKEEILDGADTMYCRQCKEHQPTKKTLSVYSTPEILVIHLKRFSSSGKYSSRSKLDDFVEAPLLGLDMSLLLDSPKNGNDLYDLFAVSNHFGGLGGGHYTAYVKDPLNDEWYDCDDSRVTPMTGPVVTPAAYLLFYRRQQHSPDNFAQILQAAQQKYESELEQQRLHQNHQQQSQALTYQQRSDSPTSTTVEEPDTAQNSRHASPSGSFTGLNSSFDAIESADYAGYEKAKDYGDEAVPISSWPPEESDWSEFDKK